MTEAFQAQIDKVEALKKRKREEPDAMRNNELRRELEKEARILVRMSKYQ